MKTGLKGIETSSAFAIVLVVKSSFHIILPITTPRITGEPIVGVGKNSKMESEFDF